MNTLSQRELTGTVNFDYEDFEQKEFVHIHILGIELGVIFCVQGFFTIRGLDAQQRLR